MGNFCKEADTAVRVSGGATQVVFLDFNMTLLLIVHVREKRIERERETLSY